jgi:nicotinamide/nicotinate riboside kinase
MVSARSLSRLCNTDTLKPAKDIPIDEESDLANWDCAESLDFRPAFVKAMQYIREHDGPSGLESKDDQNEFGQSGVLDEIVKMIADEMANRLLAYFSPLYLITRHP